MCPDSKLLSAFYDSEISSPWKDKIEDHISECAQCKAVIDGFAKQSDFLNSESEPEISCSFTDVQNLIRHNSNVRSDASRVSIFRAPVMPMAAAAAAVLAFVFGFLMAGSAGPSPSYSEIPLALSEGWSVPPGDLVIPGEDLEAMLTVIEQKSGILFNQETSMELPVDLNLSHLGDSALVRTAAYGGNSR